MNAQSGQAENENGPGVLPPILLFYRVDAEEPVQQAFDGLSDAIQPGFSLRIQDTDKIEAQGFRDEEQGPGEQRELNPTEEAHDDHSLRIFPAGGCSSTNSR